MSTHTNIRIKHFWLIPEKASEHQCLWIVRNHRICEISYILRDGDRVEILSARWHLHNKPWEKEPTAYQEIPKSVAQPVVIALMKFSLSLFGSDRYFEEVYR